jgi:uncharacterized cupin superfamily protein
LFALAIIPAAALAVVADRRAMRQAGGVPPEAPLESTEYGLVPAGEGWFVVNAGEARWRERTGTGALCDFEGEHQFAQLGINVRVVEPGEPITVYHWEADQEDFLVLRGEALLLIAGEERPLRAWDFVHCPAGVAHAIVGAGDGPCLLVAVGARDRSTGPDWGAYLVDDAALRHGCGVEVQTDDPSVAYARWPAWQSRRCGEGWLPDWG